MSIININMNEEDSEFWSGYLSFYYSNVDEYHKFQLSSFHRFFKSYQPPAGGAKLLEFGGGAVMSNLISAATKCKEIVFGEFKEDNRERVKHWLRNNPSAFNWQLFFSYVVGTLEGGTEENIEERKELLRKTVKAVVPFDIFKADPVEDKGPYDIVSSVLCLEYVCMTNEEFRESVSKLASLVKPGGTFLMQADENVHTWAYCGKTFKTYSISRNFVREVLESTGFTHITIDYLQRKSMPEEVLETLLGVTSGMFIVATK